MPRENLQYLSTALIREPFNYEDAVDEIRPDLKLVFTDADIYDGDGYAAINHARLDAISHLALREAGANRLTRREKALAKTWTTWLTDGGTISGRAGIALETTEEINRLIERLRGPADDRLVAQLLFAMNRHFKIKQEEKAAWAIRSSEQQALTEDLIHIQKAVMNRSGDQALFREYGVENIRYQRRSPTPHERLRRVVVRDGINLQASREFNYFWGQILKGREGGFETPMDMLVDAPQKLHQYRGIWFKTLEAEELERVIPEAPSGRELETVLNAMEVPVRIGLRLPAGVTIGYTEKVVENAGQPNETTTFMIDADLGPAQSANWYAGNRGNINRGYTDSTGAINGGFPFTRDWAVANGHDIHDLEANPDISAETLYTHPKITIPFSASVFEATTEQWKRDNGFVNEDNSVMSFADLQKKDSNCRILLDDDPLQGFNVIAPGDLHWTKDAMHRDATTRGPWVKGVEEMLAKKYNLPPNWQQYITYISGNSVQFKPFIVGEEGYADGKSVWNQAMGNYYAAFAEMGTDILLTLGYLRNFDIGFVKDEIPDPMRKIYQYLVYCWHYGLLPKNARFMMMTDHEDLLGTNVRLLPEYAAINGDKRFQLRYLRPIFYNDQTTTDPLHDSARGTEDEKLPMLKPLYAIDPATGDRRDLNEQEKRVLMDLYFPRRVSGLDLTDVFASYDTTRPSQWLYPNEIVHLCDKVQREIEAHLGDAAFEDRILQLLDAKLTKLAEARQKAELNDPNYHTRPEFFHVSSRQDVWGRFQQMSPELRQIIAPVHFDETIVSMAGELPSNPAEQAGWVGLGHWLNLCCDFKEFNAGTNDKVVQKRSIKYNLMTLGQTKAKEQYIRTTIQAIPRIQDLELGTDSSIIKTADDMGANAALIAIEHLMAAFGLPSGKSRATYLGEMGKALMPAANKGQADPEAAQFLAENLVMSNYMIAAGYAATMFEPESEKTVARDMSGIKEMAPLLRLDPKSKAHKLGKDKLLATGYQVHHTQQGFAVVGDRNGEAVMRQMGVVDVDLVGGTLDYKPHKGANLPLEAYGHIMYRNLELAKRQLNYLKDQGLINEVNAKAAEAHLDKIKAQFDKEKERWGDKRALLFKSMADGGLTYDKSILAKD